MWDPRQHDSLRTYKQHFDYITDFLWLGDKKQLVATSGDGSLSVMDVRSKKPEPVAHSEDQEDELLSIVTIKGGTKAVVGTQLGILSIFNRNKGWGDCVDRVPGHPMSIDALCNLPPELPGVDAGSVILTGSSDGYVRAVQLFPTKLLGVVTDHGEWPVERVTVGEGCGQLTLDRKDASGGKNIHCRASDDEDEANFASGPWWVGSVGHEEVLRLSNLEAFFRKEEEGSKNPDSGSEVGLESVSENEARRVGLAKGYESVVNEECVSDNELEARKNKKRKRKPEKDFLKAKKRDRKSVV